MFLLMEADLEQLANFQAELAKLALEEEVGQQNSKFLKEEVAVEADLRS